jgi:hypothetical protein
MNFATLSRNRTRRRMNEQASAWWNCVDGLAAVHARLKMTSGPTLALLVCAGALGGWGKCGVQQDIALCAGRTAVHPERSLQRA